MQFLFPELLYGVLDFNVNRMVHINFLVVQVGPGELSSIWLINEGREYIEAPRWADIGIVVCMLVFFYRRPGTSRPADTPTWC